MRLLLCATALAALAACQTGTPPYVAPETGATARLIFRAKTPPGVAYGVYAFDDPHTCAKPLLIGSGNATKALDSSSVRAGPLATLQYLAVLEQGRRACRVTISFYPSPRRTYLLVTDQDASACGIRLVDATDGENLKPVPAYPRRTQPGSSRCAPLAQVTKPTAESARSSGDGSAPQQDSPSTRGLDELKDLLPSD
ncbi:MAG TPA: hypothetical protein VLV56_14980 [Burkholderiales bacterium]|nr:hypothetical protein [Burkholderiales bacterium]